jgi:hypothetical protein
MKHLPRIQINGQPYPFCQETAWQKFYREHITGDAPSDYEAVMASLEPDSWLTFIALWLSIGVGLGSISWLVLRLCGAL